MSFEAFLALLKHHHIICTSYDSTKVIISFPVHWFMPRISGYQHFCRPTFYLFLVVDLFQRDSLVHFVFKMSGRLSISINISLVLYHNNSFIVEEHKVNVRIREISECLEISIKMKVFLSMSCGNPKGSRKWTCKDLRLSNYDEAFCKPEFGFYCECQDEKSIVPQEKKQISRRIKCQVTKKGHDVAHRKII